MRCRHLVVEDVILYDSLIENLARLENVTNLGVRDCYDLKTATIYYAPKRLYLFVLTRQTDTR